MKNTLYNKINYNISNTYKIGILSMQKVINYGSFLQAFALLQIIKKLRPNAVVSFIDIKPGVLIYEETRKKRSFIFIAKKILNILIKKNIRDYIHIILIKIKRIKIFKNYWKKYLDITNENNWDILFDSIVIGSDEVFNCIQYASWGFSKNLLGEGLNTNNIITYAASCGHTTISKVETMHLSKEIESALGNIKHFSVRDENTYNFVKRFANQDAFIHLDPVFLFDFSSYMQLNKPLKKPFILIYSYNLRINKSNEIAAIIDFAKMNNMELISLFGYQSWCKRNIVLEPFKILKYFEEASYVITDTFHGTIFSIKYNKKFVSFVRYDDLSSPNDNKLHYLLSIFGLQNREIKNTDDLSQKLLQEIDFEPVNKIINYHIQKSLEYLNQYL